MTYDLSTPETRAVLAPRREPYWTPIVPGVALGYRHGARGGTWHVRWRDFGSVKRYESLGAAEDGSGNGLSSEEAQERAIKIVMRAREEIEDGTITRDAIDEAAVQRIIEATRSTRFQPPAIELAALAEDLRSVRKAHRRRAREAPQVGADFQDLVNATGAVRNICERITNDQTRMNMLLGMIALRNQGGLLLPEMELQRLTQSNVELQLLAKNCADMSRFFKECSEEMGAPSHYFLLARHCREFTRNTSAGHSAARPTWMGSGPGRAFGSLWRPLNSSVYENQMGRCTAQKHCVARNAKSERQGANRVSIAELTDYL